MRFRLPLAGLGDVIALTAIVREWKRTYPAEVIEGVDCNHTAVFENNPHIGVGTVCTPRTITLSFQKTHGSVGHIPYSYAKQAGIQLFNCLPEIHLTAAEREWGRAQVVRHPAIAIDPWARWPSRRWPAERYAELAERLRKEGWFVVEIGSPVPDYRGETNESRLPCDLQGYDRFTVRETAAILAACDIFFGNESGSAHMAAAVGTPGVILYSMPRHIPARLYANQLAALNCAYACPRECLELCRMGDTAHCLAGVTVEHAMARIRLAMSLFVRRAP
jgi:hypothetical protein